MSRAVDLPVLTNTSKFGFFYRGADPGLERIKLGHQAGKGLERIKLGHQAGKGLERIKLGLSLTIG